jgi:hypothetical protein
MGTCASASNRKAYALAAPIYGRRKPRRRLIDPFVAFLREFIRPDRPPAFTELREHGYEGSYTAVTDLLREIRPSPSPVFEVRFETPPGEQACPTSEILREEATQGGKNAVVRSALFSICSGTNR